MPMIKPETDWFRQNSEVIENFSIDHAVSVRDSRIDIRRFEWVRPIRGYLAPENHYLDFSLTPDARRSVLKADAWREARHSGEVLYLPPGHHYWGEPALQRRHLLCVGLGRDFLQDLFEDDRALGAVLPSADIQNAQLRRYLQSLACELRTPGFASTTLLESMLIGTAVSLARHLHQIKEDHLSLGGGGARQARRIADYVMENLSAPLGVAEIARACGLSTRHVSRIFKEANGVGIGEFVARSRIALAKELLASDQHPVKEISWRCGFSSTSAFSAAFRAATNRTPRAYRHDPAGMQ
jgi:AraC family transcriptional regulator